VRGDALGLPFCADSFERVFSSHFYGRLGYGDRMGFLREARRVAPSLIVIDTPFQPDRPAEGPQQRDLLDGTTYTIYKKYFRPDELLDELAGGHVLLSTPWFLALERVW